VIWVAESVSQCARPIVVSLKALGATSLPNSSSVSTDEANLVSWYSGLLPERVSRTMSETKVPMSTAISLGTVALTAPARPILLEESRHHRQVSRLARANAGEKLAYVVVQETSPSLE